MRSTTRRKGAIGMSNKKIVEIRVMLTNEGKPFKSPKMTLDGNPVYKQKKNSFGEMEDVIIRQFNPASGQVEDIKDVETKDATTLDILRIIPNRIPKDVGAGDDSIRSHQLPIPSTAFSIISTRSSI